MADRKSGLTYAAAGVDIDAAEDAVRRIKDKVRSTFRPEVLGDLGGFGGMFRFDPNKYRDPVLVSTTDGVGTKAYVAAHTRRYDTIGIDLVSCSVDDLVCQGAEPLFFLDYISVGVVDPRQIEALVEGVVDGCRQANCSLIGGEISEHPGAMEPGEFDFVGFAVGVVERDRIITGEKVRPGDVLIGLPSPGLRCNGYSLARKVFLDLAGKKYSDPAWDGAEHSVADELLLPSVLYGPAVVSLVEAVDAHAIVHVTGGGIPGNLPRALPDDCDAVVDRSRWEVPRVFGEVQRIGGISDEEMSKVFNLGIGMIVVVSPKDANGAIDVLRARGHRAVEIGQIVGGTGEVVFTE